MPIKTTGGHIVLAALLPSDEPRYIALFEDAECTVEVSVPGYARVAYAGWATKPDGMTRLNPTPITWAEWPNGGSFIGVAIMDAAIGGNQLAVETANSQEEFVVIDPGNFPELDVGSLGVSIS